MEAFMEKLTKKTAGSVTLKLYKGSVSVTRLAAGSYCRNNPYPLITGDHALGVAFVPSFSGAQRFLSLIVVIFVLCEKVLTLSMAKSKITRDVPFNESKAPRLKDFGNKKGKGHCI
ncbi:hypothetical protein Bca52824_055302 [Brassica carinata]|uniref:Uncharacterized protein n=1 Tax=Brassica carinata TaxID=52824 RepID=A0A8X7RAF9_BRACI|nr:hypothetical protein Bca52824_055302 [Brassica carinata]